MRDYLTKEYQADKTCPVTTGIFLRVISKASYQEYHTSSTNKIYTHPNFDLASQYVNKVQMYDKVSRN